MSAPISLPSNPTRSLLLKALILFACFVLMTLGPLITALKVSDDLARCIGARTARNTTTRMRPRAA